MLTIIAGPRDVAVRAVASEWAPHDVRILTPRDLSMRGWSFDPACPWSSTAVVDGRPIPAAHISGLLVQLKVVVPSDLQWIAREERAYVASEMTAFLVAWISSLSCCVLNRPEPPVLTRPVWRLERWQIVASRLNIPSRAEVPADRVITVVGDLCVGDPDEVLCERARALAAACDVDLLTCYFAGQGPAARFVAADPSAPLHDRVVSQAVLRHLLDHSVGASDERRT